MSWGPDLQDKIPNVKKPEAGRTLGTVSFVLPFVFLLLFPRSVLHLLGTGLGGGQRGACNVPCHHDLGI